ncbi:MAG: SufD family Fe-S cluster assembly protein [Clostridia bacterium]|nr:SufD family Fe-S cluster assembly protein [Clostridia bacterium]MDD4376249.1 SufD family Fe-S cluster assembly protein [Clostridia bacterium]
MNNTDLKLLKEIAGINGKINGAYNIRRNGKGIERHVTDNINIVTKKDKPGIDIHVKENTQNETVYIPVIITNGGIDDTVYNDFYIGKNAKVTIIAGCGIHNSTNQNSRHEGIHTFYLEEGSQTKYVEKHYGTGEGTGDKVLNPITKIYSKKGSNMEIETVQIKGVDSSIRETKAVLEEQTTLSVSEKIMTHGKQYAKTIFDVELNGTNARTHVVSRAVAVEDSVQEFESRVEGNNLGYGHVECDAIIKDNGRVTAIPAIIANNVEANLIHEATIGKIAGEQLLKLMTLGLNEKKAEEQIISGFLK